LFRRGRGWTLDFRGADGRRHLIAVSSDKRAAERIRSELIHRRDLERAGLGTEAGQDKLLADLVADYLVDVKPRVVPLYYSYLASRFERTLEALGPIRVRDVTPAVLLRLRTQAVAAGAAPTTANRIADSVRSCLRWAVRHELIAKNPVEHITRLPQGPAFSVRQRRALTDDEVARLLASTDADDASCAVMHEIEGRVRVPQRPFLQFLIEVGARYGESCKLTWGSVDLVQRVVVLQAHTTKSRKQRAIPIRAELAERLRALQAIHVRALGRMPTSAEAVFLSPDGKRWSGSSNNTNRMLRRLLQRAGIVRIDVEGKRIDVHALRHTAASALVRRGVNIVHVQRVLGHADVRTTSAIYTHVGVEDLRQAIEGAEPVRALAAAR
jgi:integrase/recombinase XerD